MDGAKKEKKEKENWGTRMVPSRGKIYLIGLVSK
jgi:hypothetical protein